MNVFFDTVGCRLNQSEIERMAREFRSAGHNVVGKAADADIVVVNTCSVTSQAASDSRQKIRSAARLSPNAQIVATGCWATLEPVQDGSLEGQVLVVPNDEKDKLTAKVLGINLTTMDVSPLEREMLPGARHRIRAFIKAQDGCDAFCTFCVTRIARGRSRSEPVDRILTDIRSALSGGANEIVLSGVQLGSWGNHLEPRSKLKNLVKTILQETDVPRLRLSSIEPWDIDQDFFEIFTDPRICKHLHIALQSGCASTLKSMGRQTSLAEFTQIMEMARQTDEDFSITTDIITGFPGETAQEFQESLDFVRQAGFSGGHVFPYSARLGTSAVNLPGQVQSKERKTRAVQVREVLAQSARDFNQRLIGKSGYVLWETARAQGLLFQLEGLNEGFVRVVASSPTGVINKIGAVTFTSLTDTGLEAENIA
jgi:threonylcarbamoyladenosine tRNA methylthiotransferase MtaB